MTAIVDDLAGIRAAIETNAEAEGKAVCPTCDGTRVKFVGGMMGAFSIPCPDCKGRPEP